MVIADTLPRVTHESKPRVQTGNAIFGNVPSMADESWRETRDRHERLRWARLHLTEFRTAQDAAVSLGEKPGTYRAYEREPGTSKSIPFDHQFAVRAGKKFGVRWEWLLTGQGTPFDEKGGDTFLDRVAVAFKDASPEKKAAIVEIVERLMKAG